MDAKHAGKDTILYQRVRGALQSTGVLALDSWFEIVSKGGTSALPANLKVGTPFKSPKLLINQITLAAGDSVYPLTLTEICKTDVSISGEMGVIDVTDSCDFPYTANLTDGFTKLSGSLNRFLKFDPSTDKLVPVSLDFLNRFFDIIEDDAAGVYTLNAKDDADLVLMIVLNRDSLTVVGKVQNWLVLPIILKSVSMPVNLKDALKSDFSWEKATGVACIYTRVTAA